ncbi:MAG TPA: VanZ family protein [Flavobacteriaceae bacterium]|nr:VanZ family protein [Flavobacteriaceae bacterium]
MAPKLLLLVAVAYTILILYGSLVTPQGLPKITKGVPDKWLHSLGYFFWFLFWFLYLFFNAKKNKFFHCVWKVVVAGLVFGIIIEVLQETLTSTRTAEVLDAAANFTGLVIAACIVVVFKSKLLKLKNDISF